MNGNVQSGACSIEESDATEEGEAPPRLAFERPTINSPQGIISPLRLVGLARRFDNSALRVLCLNGDPP